MMQEFFSSSYQSVNDCIASMNPKEDVEGMEKIWKGLVKKWQVGCLN
jgi:hypothetical protein